MAVTDHPQNNQLDIKGCYRPRNNQSAVNGCYHGQRPRPEKFASGKQTTVLARERERETERERDKQSTGCYHGQCPRLDFDVVVWADIAKKCGLLLYKRRWHGWWWWRVEEQISNFHIL
jgi:hypothetical protein